MTKYTDYITRYTAVNFIRYKNDALETLLKLVQTLAIPVGLRVQFLRSDNGAGYTGHTFQDYCKKHRHRSTTYCPAHASAKYR